MAGSYDIKAFKPRIGDIKQGYYLPLNPNKYVGDITTIIFRSSWELKFLQFCDTNSDILRYSSEPVAIPYYNPNDNKVHKYYVDFYIEMRTETNRIRRMLIEVKPMKYIKIPVPSRNPTYKALKRFQSEMTRYITNNMKFEAARNFAREQGMEFGIITENFVFKTI
jgi:hypothetical protein